MNNAKEKAIELVEKMYSTQGAEYGITEYEAKQCALIANNEILEYSKAHGFIELTKFYEEVKQEIEKL
jgi:hypothetical protein